MPEFIVGGYPVELGSVEEALRYAAKVCGKYQGRAALEFSVTREAREEEFYDAIDEAYQHAGSWLTSLLDAVMALYEPQERERCVNCGTVTDGESCLACNWDRPSYLKAKQEELP